MKLRYISSIQGQIFNLHFMGILGAENSSDYVLYAILFFRSTFSVPPPITFLELIAHRQHLDMP